MTYRSELISRYDDVHARLWSVPKLETVVLPRPPGSPDPREARRRATVDRIVHAARRYLEDERVLNGPRTPTMREVADNLCARRGITVDLLISHRRGKALTRVRQEFYYLAYSRTQHNLAEIARFCGARDHSTITHGIRAHCDRNEIPHPDEKRGASDD